MAKSCESPSLTRHGAPPSSKYWRGTTEGRQHLEARQEKKPNEAKSPRRILKFPKCGCSVARCVVRPSPAAQRRQPSPSRHDLRQKKERKSRRDILSRNQTGEGAEWNFRKGITKRSQMPSTDAQLFLWSIAFAPRWRLLSRQRSTSMPRVGVNSEKPNEAK